MSEAGTKDFSTVPEQDMTVKDHSVKLSLRNQPSEMTRINEALDSLKAAADLSDRDLFVARLCSEEVFTNIIVHGLKDDTDHLIAANFNVTDEAITITFRDDGIPFDPREIARPEVSDDLMALSEGGRGVALVTGYAERVDYAYIGGKNCLTLIIRRTSATDHQS